MEGRVTGDAAGEGEAERGRRLPVVNDACTLCGSCVNACPANALSIARSRAPPEKLEGYEGVYVWGEWRRVDGKVRLRPVVGELLGVAGKLAERLDEPVGVALLGPPGIGRLAGRCFELGADVVALCEHPLLGDYSTDGFAAALVTVVLSRKPSVLLFGATHDGRDLAPRVAARLGAGLTADCTGLDVDDEGRLVQTRPAFGGNVMASIVTPHSRPQMATVRPRVFPAPAADRPRRADRRQAGKVVKVDAKIEKFTVRTRVLEDVVEGGTTGVGACVEDADVLVSVGRGIGSRENVELAKELARALGGTLACSRALVDAGWLPHPRQVGQSGKTVCPRLYLALGISGAVQHLVGMRSSDVVVAVNKDPDAPIFEVADLGVVGDAVELIPKILRILEESDSGATSSPKPT
ncbi:MAG: electron transfer flavoprotein subunit alpha [Promethearchaeota archaeon]